MTKRLSPEEKAARAAARKAAKTPPPQGKAKERTVDNQTDPAGAAQPEIAPSQPSPEAELKRENRNDQTPAAQGAEQPTTSPEAPEEPEAKASFLPEGGSPPAAPQGQKPGLGRLIEATRQLRREHRRTAGTGYPRIFVDNVCRALDQYEQEREDGEAQE